MSYNPTLLEASDWWKARNSGTNYILIGEITGMVKS